MIKVGILKETKNPPDKRVPVTPSTAKQILSRFSDLSLCVQKSNIRAIQDEEYEKASIPLTDSVHDCDILLGVKEVAISNLVAGKTYLYFSHTAKKQPYNRKLLQEMSKLGITMIDYEYLTDKNNVRLVAFGRWAGIVGAYNGIMAYGMRTGLFNLKRAYDCYDMKEMVSQLDPVKLPPVKILVTGGGRVAYGALETLSHLRLQEVSPQDFLSKQYDEAVICRLDPWDYVKRKDGNPFELQHFFTNPQEYESTFLPYTKITDIFIPCHFWDPKSPVFMTPAHMRESDFNIKVIADVSCDIKDPIPSTIRPSTIADPVYGYHPHTDAEGEPFADGNITVMAIDNLPGELPRDASEDFAGALLEKVFPSLIGNDNDGIIERATILKNGKLTPRYAYLQQYLEGKE